MNMSLEADRQWIRRQHALAAATFAIAALAALCGDAWADEHLLPIGGPGGGQFTARCPLGEFLIGFEIRKGDFVDAVRPLCASAHGPRDVGASVRGDWHGGTGGRPMNLTCPRGEPVVNGMLMSFEDVNDNIVYDLGLVCGPTAGRQVKPGGNFVSDAEMLLGGLQHCPFGQAAVGLHGRSGLLLDAIGLICDAPPTAEASTGKSIAKVDKPATPRPPGWTICDAAREARSRSSPVAPNLEAQCAASTAPAKSLGKLQTSLKTGSPPVASSSSVPATPAPPAPPVPTKEETRDAALRALASAIQSGVDEARRNRAANASRGTDTPRRRGSEPVERMDNVARSSDLIRSQPENSIYLDVHYPAAYGYQSAQGPSDPAPNSCGAFYVSVLSAQDVWPHGSRPIDAQPHMLFWEDVYYCQYLIRDMPLNQPITVSVRMSNERTADNESWLGGSESQPPVGQRRTVNNGTQQIKLTASNSRASLNFEMTYSGGP